MSVVPSVKSTSQSPGPPGSAPVPCPQESRVFFLPGAGPSATTWPSSLRSPAGSGEQNENTGSQARRSSTHLLHPSGSSFIHAFSWLAQCALDSAGRVHAQYAVCPDRPCRPQGQPQPRTARASSQPPPTLGLLGPPPAAPVGLLWVEPPTSVWDGVSSSS